MEMRTESVGSLPLAQSFGRVGLLVYPPKYSTVVSKARAMSIAFVTRVDLRPCSMSLIACLDRPASSPNCCCVKFSSFRLCEMRSPKIF